MLINYMIYVTYMNTDKTETIAIPRAIHVCALSLVTNVDLTRMPRTPPNKVIMIEALMGEDKARYVGR
jgi:hypothetical protein